MLFISLVSSVIVGTLTPCYNESSSCPPPPPCPTPPPHCVEDANPLVLDEHGKCCPEFPCAPVNCAPSCQTDGGSSFADSPAHYYDCTRTNASLACFKGIDPESKACSCLLRDCISSSSLLSRQTSMCVLPCQDDKVTGAGICPDWDDNHDFCNFYATWLCVATSSSCDRAAMVPPPTACEARCTAKAAAGGASDPEDTLDAFLQCVTSCISRGP